MNAISGTRLNVIGRVFLRVCVGKHLLRVLAYVVTSINNNFVVGNDVMKRHKMIIDYESDKLLIKAENVYTLDNVVIPPNSLTTIRVRPKVQTLIPGVVGQIDINNEMRTKGLLSENIITTMPLNSILQYTAFNNKSQTLKLTRRTCIGSFKAVNKDDNNEGVQIVRIKGNNLNEHNENVSYKNTDGTVNTPMQVIESITVQPQPMAPINTSDIEITPLEFNIDNDNLTIDQKQKLIELLNKNRHIFAAHDYDIGEFNGGEFKIELKPGMKPPKCQPYRTSPKQRKLLTKRWKNYLK